MLLRSDEALGPYEALTGFVGAKAWAKALAKTSILHKAFYGPRPR
jgi:hypothetical protein